MIQINIFNMIFLKPFHKIRLNPLSTLIFIILMGSCKNVDEEKSLLLYCAAGTKPVAEKVAKDYYKEYGVRIDIQYGGSGTLLANLRIAQQGDLYLAADKSYIDEAKKFGLLNETQSLAQIKPVIAVTKGNPKNIQNIEDLFNSNIKVALANPDAASIGRLTKKMLIDSQQWQDLEQNISVLLPTVNEITNSIKIGASDAGIVWDAIANQYETIDIVSTPLFDSYIKNITIGVLKYSNNPTEALKFLRYFSAKDKGSIVFNNLGYKAIDGDSWSEKPRILFYSGGVNRLAIDQTIQSFEKREGVEVIRVYNGCGILVSQIKAGQQPDAYLSCDSSFMTQVETKFNHITDISKTEIVIVTKNNNPKNIQNLNDLTKNNLQIGICNAQQSALGSLTKRMLERLGIWDEVYKNIRSQTPTADLLVNQIRTGSLDAVIVYEANIASIRDKLNLIRIDNDDAIAMQNFGISINSDNYYLTRRLLEALTNETSKNKYLDNGFQWNFEAFKSQL